MIKRAPLIIILAIVSAWDASLILGRACNHHPLVRNHEEAEAICAEPLSFPTALSRICCPSRGQPNIGRYFGES